jgi:hypothetical protein
MSIFPFLLISVADNGGIFKRKIAFVNATLGFAAFRSIIPIVVVHFRQIFFFYENKVSNYIFMRGPSSTMISWGLYNKSSPLYARAFATDSHVYSNTKLELGNTN